MCVCVSDGNEMPAVSGLNQVVEVSEDAAAGTVLARFSVIQAGDSPLCHLAAEPPQALHFFHVQGETDTGGLVTPPPPLPPRAHTCT